VPYSTSAVGLNAQPTKNMLYPLIENFTHAYSNQIVQKWIDYFVLHKQVRCEKVERKIK